MGMADSFIGSQLDQLTKRTVRTFWLDGLWELVLVGALILFGAWGIYYVQLVAFPESTWPFLHGLGRNTAWIGLFVIVVILAVYVWLGWKILKRLKRLWISPLIGHAQHTFFMPVEAKVYRWYFVLYLLGIGLLYGLFAWIDGGVHVMSVPIIISPAAIYWAIGRIYAILRYQWTAILGLVVAITLELLLTWPAAYQSGPQDFLNIRPEWGSPALPSFIWAAVFLISGLIGFITVRRGQYEA
jgi:hypothetical protein